MYKLIKYLNYNTSLINLLGIQMYLYLYLSYCNIIPLIVYVNGIITHSSVKFKYHYIIMYYDIIINFILISYVTYILNAYIGTGIVFSIFLLNFLLIKNKVINELIHVICVHIPLAVALDFYMHNNNNCTDLNNQCIEYKKGVICIYLWL